MEIAVEGTVDELRQRAQDLLEVGGGELLTVSGTVLEGQLTVSQAGLQDGDSLTLRRKPVQVGGPDNH